MKETPRTLHHKASVLDLTGEPGAHVDATSEEGLDEAEAEIRLKQFGLNELPDNATPWYVIFLSHFTGLMPGMIVLACLIEYLLKEWPDFYTLMTLLFLNGFVGFWEDMRAGDAVAALKASLKPEATVKRNNLWRKIDASLLVPGDRVALAAGFSVPADCIVSHGMEIQVDQAALTGESLPVSMSAGSQIMMGSTVVSGEVDGVVCNTGINTFFGKTAALIGSTHDEGNFQKVVLSITQVLFAFSSVLVTIAVVHLIMRDPGQLWEAVSFGVVLLVASIPIAMQVVCTATMALGSRMLAEKKAIVARLASIEQLAGMTILCSDKTGTLTLNKMVLQEMVSYDDKIQGPEILTYAALAIRWKEPPKDALDTLVLMSDKLDREYCDKHVQLDFVPFDPKRKRTEATLRGPNGAEFEVVKGAPNVLLTLIDKSNYAAIGNAFQAKVDNLAERGIRALAVAKKDKGGVMKMVGMLTFLDPPRPDTKATIRNAMMQGVSVKMITGDHQAIARETARQLGMGDNISSAANLPTLAAGDAPPTTLGRDYGEMITNSDGFAGVYPEHKFLIVETLRQLGHSVGMTGDGVNDAPALKKADVGIAVEGATDAARAAADLVLTAPGLSVIVDAIEISRAIFQRMKNYVIYRVACTIQLLLFFFVAVFAFEPHWYNDKFKQLPGHPYKHDIVLSDGSVAHFEYGFRMTEREIGLDIPGTFNLPVIALVVIVILNDATIVSTAYDNVKASQLPEKWNLPILFIVAAWIGFVACGSSLLLLDWALSSEDPDSPMRQLGLSSSLSYGQIIAMMYLKISLSDWWTIFAARTQDWCWTRAPSKIVASAALFATLTSTYFSVTWPFQDIRFDEVLYLEGEEAAREHQEDVQLIGLDFEHVVFTWCFCGVFFVIQDTAKVLCYRVLFHYDVCGIKTDALANEERIAANERIQNGLSHSVTTNPKDILVGIEKQQLLHAGTVQSLSESGAQGGAPWSLSKALFGKKR
jgi:H+-transporting ATPase